MSFTWEHFALNGSLTRVTAHDPIWAFDGEACAVLAPFALCGFAQYWRSVASPAQPGAPLAAGSSFAVPTLFIGGAIAFGLSGAARL